MATFRASARTLDLLGRQQIANVPSAINELFKNSYDAYATRVEVDLVRPEDLMILRDNGIGMTKKDFEEKWLVLGTDSKFNISANPGYRPQKAKIRPIAGEKGIGRLAIGMLGPQSLILTRAVRADGLHPIIAAFVNWSAFAIPGIDLTDIQVPVRELNSQQEINAKLLSSLVQEFRTALQRACVGKDTQGFESLVYEELNTLTLDPWQWIAAFGDLSFDNGGTGTHFFIQKVTPIVWDSIEPEPEKTVSELSRHLIGFSDQMSSEAQDVPISLAFRVHSGPANFEDIIEEAQFWTFSDFQKADHEVHGSFDEFGHFLGQIRIYNNKPVEHRIPNRESRGHKTDCGVFDFHLGYMQGLPSESRLDPIEFSQMSARLNEIAGVYVYRDGLRVLPYGDQENDWLRIEERRNKGAAYYFFSYRRMFGCVCISRQNNPGLKDKAGREGFQQTRAYAQLRNLINNVLIQMAGDFFRSKDENTPFRRGKSENEKRYKAWERHQESKGVRLKKFRTDLQRAEELLKSETLKELVSLDLAQLQVDLENAKRHDQADDLVRSLLDLETKYTERLRGYATSLDVKRPRGISLPVSVSRAFTQAQERKGREISEVIEPAQATVQELIQIAAKDSGTSLDERLRVTTQVERHHNQIMRKVRSDSAASKSSAQDLAVKIALLSNQIVSELDQRLRTILAEVNSFQYEQATENQIEAFLSRCRNESALAEEFFDNGLVSLKELLEGIVLDWNEDDGLLSSLDIAESIDAELTELSESTTNDLELAQIGLAIDIVNHEFLSAINAVRKGLTSLASWAQHFRDLAPVYTVLNSNFQHLENFLQVFTPLRRRNNVERTQITGTEIRDYVNAVFHERAKDLGVSIEITPAFLQKRVFSFASVLLPAFVNLVDNALFWLKDRPEPRRIVLDSVGNDWLISDNGPGIPEQYRNAVFTAGYTSKPGGRGLGLYIAREVLRRNGLDLVIDNPRLESGSTFKIRKKEEADNA